jgi:hypothetical protein
MSTLPAERTGCGVVGRRVLAALCSFGVALGVARWAGAQEAPRFDLRASYPFRVGDRVRVVQGNRHEGLVNVLQRGKPLRVENRRGGFELRYVDEVLELSRSGQPIRVKRSYERVKDWATGQEDRRRRDVVLDYTGDKMQFQAQDELPEVAQELLEHSSQVPLSAYEHLIPPDGPVPVGHRWTIPNAPAAQIFLLDPEALAEGSVCTGQLASTRQQGQVLQTQVVLAFRLRFLRMFDIVFDAPAELECTLDIWDAAHGGAPTGAATTRGSLAAEGRVPNAPKDVTVKMDVTVTGTYQCELLDTAR